MSHTKQQIIEHSKLLRTEIRKKHRELKEFEESSRAKIRNLVADHKWNSSYDAITFARKLAEILAESRDEFNESCERLREVVLNNVEEDNI